MALPVDLVIFDLMGTLVNDSGAMEGALKGVLTHYGVPFTEADHKAMRGAGKTEVFQAILERTIGAGKDITWSHDKALEMYATFKVMLREKYDRHGRQEIPGAEATLRWLREQGARVAATTSLDLDIREPMLEAFGWAEGIFDCKVSTQEVPAGRPAPYMNFLAMMRTGVTDVRKVAAVGDTPVDLQAGTNAGCGWVVGLLTGGGTLETLGLTPHTHILPSVADLPKIWR